jgi:hypothetical protein
MFIRNGTQNLGLQTIISMNAVAIGEVAACLIEVRSLGYNGIDWQKGFQGKARKIAEQSNEYRRGPSCLTVSTVTVVFGKLACALHGTFSTESTHCGHLARSMEDLTLR